MTPEEHKLNAVSMIVALATVARVRGIADDDMPAVVSVAASEILGRLLGPVGAVEHLRNVADLLERQIMAEFN